MVLTLYVEAGSSGRIGSVLFFEGSDGAGFLCITKSWLSWTSFVDQAGSKLTEIHFPLPP